MLECPASTRCSCRNRPAFISTDLPTGVTSTLPVDRLILRWSSYLSCNPIEKKPLFHFYPGSIALTAGTLSCNSACPWCQNWYISKRAPAGGEFISPDEFVNRARELGLHLEVTTLVIPGVNDQEEVLRGIAGELGAEVPWHLTRYYPACRFSAPPTLMVTLEGAYRIGREAGLDFVYLGNLPGYGGEDTLCPGCGAILIERGGLVLRTNRLEEGYCPECGRLIPGVWNRPD